jgi:hypothetical protein
VFQIKSGATQRKRGLYVEGEVGQSLSENVKSFKQALNTITADMNPKDSHIDIQVKLTVGSDFKTIEGVIDIY